MIEGEEEKEREDVWLTKKKEGDDESVRRVLARNCGGKLC